MDMEDAAMADNNGLRAERERIGIGQKVLADITGISVAKLSKIEHDKRNMKPEELVILSYALGVGPSTLVGLRDTDQLRLAKARSPRVREGLAVLDRFIDNCHFLDGLAALSGKA
jgi:transcriptional regulator with XRE-family HTH domain